MFPFTFILGYFALSCSSVVYFLDSGVLFNHKSRPTSRSFGRDLMDVSDKIKLPPILKPLGSDWIGVLLNLK